MSQLEVEKLEKSSLSDAFEFLESVFTQEQHIPKELIPLNFDEQFWWCIQSKGHIVGTVAAWKDGIDWHWGRLAVDMDHRGYGLGKKLAIRSFNDLFHADIKDIVIDARDITVSLLQSLGAKVIGPTTEFYSIPITPMILTKDEFENSRST